MSPTSTPPPSAARGVIPTAPRSVRSLVDPGEGQQSHAPHGKLSALTLGALGVVFGDIGTSPLYTLKECILGDHTPKPTTPEEAVLSVLGILSMIFWSLTMVVSVKYLSFIMKADNHGEGGILALLALAPERLCAGKGVRKVRWVAIIVLIGAGLLYGDGMITPAISVLSAVEGLKVPGDLQAAAGIPPGHFFLLLKKAVVPLTCIILIGVFAIQKRGTGSVGRYFGPIMLLWFITIGGLGAYHLIGNPRVLMALSPHYAVLYFRQHGLHAFGVLGGVVLAITGGEALYADMGHFGARPIRLAWWFVAMPGLVLNYFGQGALLLRDPKGIIDASATFNPFYATVLQWGVVPLYALVGLATAATIIASQALISGAYSLTSQAIQLGYFPRVTVRHTSRDAEGQIYIPYINWLLMISCVFLVLWKEESQKLAAAYGIAVTGTMGITSIVYYVVARNTWGWSFWKAGSLVALFLCFDLTFFGANAVKFFEGGWFPIAVGAAFFAVMFTWRIGRAHLGDYILNRSPKMDEFLENLDKRLTARIPGVGVFMASNSARVPPVLAHHADRIRVLHETVILFTSVTEHVPNVPVERRLETQDIGFGFYRVIARCGFMETPNVPELIAEAAERLEIAIEPSRMTYYLGRETFLASGKGRMGKWSEMLFGFLSRNAQPATMYFGIPPEQVIELGTQIDL